MYLVWNKQTKNYSLIYLQKRHNCMKYTEKERQANKDAQREKDKETKIVKKRIKINPNHVFLI